MAEFMNIVKGRRSIRKYQEKEVPEAALSQILEAVQWSPSWANSQCWEIIVVKDAAIKQKLQETIAPKNPATYAITGAPVVLALCGKLNSSGYYKDQVTTKFGDWFLFDLGIASQSICLSACQLGLGTVIVGLFDHNKARDVLGVPPGYEVAVLIPLGYPDKDSPAPKRREITEFTHHNKF